ncbi:rod shape-determining protein MreD [Blautia pseudococcoides]|uniref:rod shape-determining protein MreD n=1 Tax=Blautia pseudococcoides TaxID=1796616 RepID=UPI00148B2537|nr:rod shape-determining protein MreD [Blautia pseudococcoides]QJU14323.1 rod shape-determining protein MreD [Blautia pseudococcoides]
MRIQRKVVTLLLILISAILQGTLFKALSIGSITPNLLLILAVSFGFMRGKKNGIWIGFFCGILKDLLSDGLLGFYALVYLCIGYAAGCCCKLFYDEELRVPIILMAAGDLVYGGLVYGMQYLMRGRIEFYYYFGRIIIPEMIYTVLMTVLLYRLLFNINKRLTELEMKERDSIWLRK